ncbi:hypothetical protein Tco_0447400, partial [Tanacetum coccineum]
VPIKLVLIDSSRVVVRSVWDFVGDVEYEGLRPGDIKLLLVAFDSQLKIFHPFLNDDSSGEHS